MSSEDKPAQQPSQPIEKRPPDPPNDQTSYDSPIRTGRPQRGEWDDRPATKEIKR
jgi:hypothetical protein